MNRHVKTEKEPLFHIVKRAEIATWKAILIRIAAIAAGFLVGALVVFCLIKVSPIRIYKAMFSGAFGTRHRIWNLLQSLAMLLCISLAVTPAFKMRFWNIGAEGQVLVGGLATAACMYYFGGKMPTVLLFAVMILASIAAGIIWAVIPAFFKAKWNTNETLFTLMMNYIATQLVTYFLSVWVKTGSGTLAPMSEYGFPRVGPHDYFLNIVIVAVLTVLMYIYLKYSKQGYEISVVGESENTARYVGINVKKVILRTMALSGALCGIGGLLLVGGTNHTVSTTTAGGRGFTAIMVAWLAKFNPLTMVLTSFLIAFLQAGAKQISTTFRVNDSISDILTAILLFFIIGCEFFIQYRVVFNKPSKEARKDQ